MMYIYVYLPNFLKDRCGKLAVDEIMELQKQRRAVLSLDAGQILDADITHRSRDAGKCCTPVKRA